jgi:hypothetical protein
MPFSLQYLAQKDLIFFKTPFCFVLYFQLGVTAYLAQAGIELWSSTGFELTIFLLQPSVYGIMGMSHHTWPNSLFWNNFKLTEKLQELYKEVSAILCQDSSIVNFCHVRLSFIQLTSVLFISIYCFILTVLFPWIHQFLCSNRKGREEWKGEDELIILGKHWVFIHLELGDFSWDSLKAI